MICGSRRRVDLRRPVHSGRVARRIVDGATALGAESYPTGPLQAGVKQLILFHHDPPLRSRPRRLAQIVLAAQQEFEPTSAAREGMVPSPSDA